MGKDTGAQPKQRLTDRIRHSLGLQVSLIVLLSYLIPLVLLGGFAGASLLNELEKKTRTAITSGAEQAWTLTKQNVDRTVELARDATYDGELTDAWQKWKSGEIGDAEYMRLCRGYLERKYSREQLLSFSVCFPADNPQILMYVHGGDNSTSAELQKLRETAMAKGDDLDTDCLFLNLDGRLYLVRNLLDLRMERYGMLILGIDRERLFRPLTDLERTWNAKVTVRLGDYGESETDWDSLTPGLEDDGKEKLVYTRLARDEDNAPDIQLTMNRREQYSEIYTFRWLLIVIIVLLIVLMALIAVYLNKRIVKPVTILSDASRRIEEGELGVTVPLNGGDELGRLGQSFSHMSLRLKELIDRTYKEEIELKNAQILALQSRINPHFINNALEEINWEARIEGSENISSMVTSLSVLLNATMARENRRLVTLREEMEVAEAYIFFIQQRFGEDVEVVRETDEDAMDGILPLLTIQPLLENAVEHGIAPAGGGKIILRCFLDSGVMHIEIINTGRGAAKEDRERIEAALRGEADGKHLGLANIVNRLRLIYGENVMIRVDTDQPDRTSVRIGIPQENRQGGEEKNER